MGITRTRRPGSFLLRTKEDVCDGRRDSRMQGERRKGKGGNGGEENRRGDERKGILK